MEKIGIITFHRAVNYGAVLQTYATQEFLRKNNYNVEIIDYRDRILEAPYRFLQLPKGGIKTKIKKILDDVIFFKKNNRKNKNFQKFVKENLNLSKTYNNIYKLKQNYPKDKIYITGSDQVWNTSIVGCLSDAYTLNFGNEEIKRISYAASIGLSEIDIKYQNEYKEKLKEIDYISVREESAKLILNKLIKRKDIQVVLDPTLLLNKEFWNSKLDRLDKEKEKYILVYSVAGNNEYINIANYLSKETGLKIIHFEKMNRFDNELKNVYSEGPFEFLNLIRGAEYIITNSFHAVVFSIIFSKKFYCVPYKKTSSRIINLLEKLEISQRIVYTLDEFKNKQYDEKIDYDEVNKKLETERKKSTDWLIDAINS